jgi:hypothetical protein
MIIVLSIFIRFCNSYFPLPSLGGSYGAKITRANQIGMISNIRIFVFLSFFNCLRLSRCACELLQPQICGPSITFANKYDDGREKVYICEEIHYFFCSKPLLLFRHPYMCDYSVGFTDDGIITTFDAKVYAGAGFTLDGTDSCLLAVIMSIDNCYKFQNFRAEVSSQSKSKVFGQKQGFT